MNRVKIIAKNIFSLYTGKLISIIISVLLAIYIARFLGDILFGRYSFILAFVTLFSIFIDLGYETFLIREVSKKKSEASFYVNNIFGFDIFIYKYN